MKTAREIAPAVAKIIEPIRLQKTLRLFFLSNRSKSNRQLLDRYFSQGANHAERLFHIKKDTIHLIINASIILVSDGEFIYSFQEISAPPFRAPNAPGANAPGRTRNVCRKIGIKYGVRGTMIVSPHPIFYTDFSWSGSTQMDPKLRGSSVQGRIFILRFQ